MVTLNKSDWIHQAPYHVVGFLLNELDVATADWLLSVCVITTACQEMHPNLDWLLEMDIKPGIYVCRDTRKKKGVTCYVKRDNSKFLGV